MKKQYVNEEEIIQIIPAPDGYEILTKYPQGDTKSKVICFGVVKRWKKCIETGEIGKPDIYVEPLIESEYGVIIEPSEFMTSNVETTLLFNGKPTFQELTK